jgi:hypothetical protein
VFVYPLRLKVIRRFTRCSVLLTGDRSVVFAWSFLGGPDYILANYQGAGEQVTQALFPWTCNYDQSGWKSAKQQRVDLYYP